MQDGIYHVSFSSNANDFGEGIAVIKNGSVNGGDHGYVYAGTLQEVSGAISAVITIKQWNRGVPSVFGPASELVLELVGSSSGEAAFTANGSVRGHPGQMITIRGEFLSKAA